MSDVEAINWKAFRLEFFELNLETNRVAPFTLRDLADRHGLNYQSLRNIAGAEKWYDELRDMIDEKREESRRMVLNAQIEGEVEVRVRQAHSSRVLATKALLKLQSIDPSNLTVKEALYMWEMATVQERKALGLDDHFVPPAQVTSADKKVEAAVQTAMEVLGRLKARKAAALEAPRERAAS